MSTNKESELIIAVLMYALRCLAEGDQQSLQAMNFGPKELEALRNMNVADLYRANSLRTHCLRIDLNRDVFWPMLEHLKLQRESEELQRELIVADASLEMMQSLFGWSSREYTRWRKLLTVSHIAGRPAEPDEPTSHRLWYTWRDYVKDRDDETLTAADYFQLHIATKIDVRVIWSLIQRWEAYGREEGELSEH